jgi:hypothetical protein
MKKRGCPGISDNLLNFEVEVEVEVEPESEKDLERKT